MQNFIKTCTKYKIIDKKLYYLKIANDKDSKLLVPYEF